MGISGLHYKKLGSGHPLIILHGLYGSGSNWLSIAKELADICEVYLLDKRNHGRSPHHEEHNYQVLMEDLHQFLDDQGVPKAMLLGHSMGGKTAMYMAINYPGYWLASFRSLESTITETVKSSAARSTSFSS